MTNPECETSNNGSKLSIFTPPRTYQHRQIRRQTTPSCTAPAKIHYLSITNGLFKKARHLQYFISSVPSATSLNWRQTAVPETATTDLITIPISLHHRGRTNQLKTHSDFRYCRCSLQRVGCRTRGCIYTETIENESIVLDRTEPTDTQGHAGYMFDYKGRITQLAPIQTDLCSSIEEKRSKKLAHKRRRLCDRSFQFEFWCKASHDIRRYWTSLSTAARHRHWESNSNIKRVQIWSNVRLKQAAALSDNVSTKTRHRNKTHTSITKTKTLLSKTTTVRPSHFK